MESKEHILKHFADEIGDPKTNTNLVHVIEKAPVMKHIEMLVKALEEYAELKMFGDTAREALAAHKEWLEKL